MPNIYDFLLENGPATEARDVARQLAKTRDRTRTILQIALESPVSSRLCTATLGNFISVLASEAGNLMLKVMATGGLYIAGDIPAHILPVLETGAFVRFLCNKGRFSELLSRVPIHVFISQAPLIGAAAYGLSRVQREGTSAS